MPHIQLSLKLYVLYIHLRGYSWTVFHINPQVLLKLIVCGATDPNASMFQNTIKSNHSLNYDFLTWFQGKWGQALHYYRTFIVQSDYNGVISCR